MKFVTGIGVLLVIAGWPGDAGAAPPREAPAAAIAADGPAPVDTAFTATAGGEAESDWMAADINGDGVVDALDVQLMINAALGAMTGIDTADVNRDGRIDALDVQLTVNAALVRKGELFASGIEAWLNWFETFRRSFLRQVLPH